MDGSYGKLIFRAWRSTGRPWCNIYFSIRCCYTIFAGEQGHSFSAGDWDKLLLRHSCCPQNIDCFSIGNDNRSRVDGDPVRSRKTVKLSGKKISTVMEDAY